MLTILYPTFNEMHLDYLTKNLQLFQLLDLEVLFIDGGSMDTTVPLLQDHHQRVLHLPHSSRAEKFQRGIESTAGPMILFHHPRSHLSLAALQHLISLSQQKIWGGFQHRFDDSHWVLTFTSWYSNTIRFCRGILYLDHCPFAHRSLVEAVGGFPQYHIFEDTAFSAQLRKLMPPTLLPFMAETSAIRFQKNGMVFQILMNQLLKCSYYLGVRDERMNQFYERGLELNQRYRKSS